MHDLRLHHQWYPQVLRVADYFSAEITRHYADYRERISIHADGAADYARIAVEFALPVRVTNHHHRIAARRPSIFSAEGAADYGIRSQQRKEILTHDACRGALGNCGLAGLIHGHHGRRS